MVLPVRGSTNFYHTLVNNANGNFDAGLTLD